MNELNVEVMTCWGRDNGLIHPMLHLSCFIYSILCIFSQLGRLGDGLPLVFFDPQSYRFHKAAAALDTGDCGFGTVKAPPHQCPLS